MSNVIYRENLNYLVSRRVNREGTSSVSVSEGRVSVDGSRLCLVLSKSTTVSGQKLIHSEFFLNWRRNFFAVQ